MRTTIPAHDFQPVQQASVDGPILICAYLHEADDSTNVWCPELADHPVHRGGTRQVEVGALEVTR